jgi:hypothetical protein
MPAEYGDVGKKCQYNVSSKVKSIWGWLPAQQKTNVVSNVSQKKPFQ